MKLPTTPRIWTTALKRALIDFDQLRAEVPVFAVAYDDVERKHPQGPQKLKFNEALKRMLDRFATDLIENYAPAGEAERRAVRGRYSPGARSVGGVFRRSRGGERAALKRFLITRVYSQPAIAEDRAVSVAALDALFSFSWSIRSACPNITPSWPKNEPRASRRLRLHRGNDRPFPAAAVPGDAREQGKQSRNDLDRECRRSVSVPLFVWYPGGHLVRAASLT